MEFSYHTQDVIIICGTVAFCAIVKTFAMLLIAHERNWTALETARLSLPRNNLPTPQVKRGRVPQMLVRCGCGQEVAVDSALATARPGRMIQMCRCGNIVWPPRDARGSSASRGDAATRLRAAVGLSLIHI